MIEIKCLNKDIAMKWFVIRYCNFNCPGCIEGSSNVRDFTKEMLEEQTKQAKIVGDKILNYLNSFENKTIQLTLTGGECTLVDLKYIFEDWKEIGQKNDLRIQIITNFSAPNNKYRSLFDMLKSYNINPKLTVSVHESQWKNFDYLVNKIIEMKDDISCVNYVINDETKDEVMKYFNALSPYVKQRLGVDRNKKVEYNASNEIWDIINKSNVKRQMQWTENGVTEKLDMDTMYHTKIGAEGFFGWECYPLVKVNPDGSAFICRKTPVDLNNIPTKITCQRCGKCTPYNWTKVVEQ